MIGRYEKNRETVMVRYRSSASSPHYTGGEFIDIHINMYCPACPDDGDQCEMLKLTEDEEIVADCPKCGYHARVSVYEEGA